MYRKKWNQRNIRLKIYRILIVKYRGERWDVLLFSHRHTLLLSILIKVGEQNCPARSSQWRQTAVSTMPSLLCSGPAVPHGIAIFEVRNSRLESLKDLLSAWGAASVLGVERLQIRAGKHLCLWVLYLPSCLPLPSRTHHEVNCVCGRIVVASGSQSILCSLVYHCHWLALHHIWEDPAGSIFFSY